MVSYPFRHSERISFPGTDEKYNDTNFPLLGKQASNQPNERTNQSGGK